jgi:hypothetical protein
MSHLLDGLTEVQMLRIISDLKKGISFEDATAFLDNEVYPAAIERNKEFLVNRANDQLEAEKPPSAKIEKPSHKK